MGASSQALPPPNVAFRLVGLQSSHAFFSRWSGDPTFWHYSGPVSDDQWWYLIPGTGDHAGYYLLKSKYTGKVMFSRAEPDPRVGHISGDGKYDDNWFFLEFGSGSRVGHFRVRNKASDMVLVSRTTQDPKVTNYAGTSGVYDDQYFSFICENVTLDRIDYDIKKAKILSSTTIAMGSQTNRNPCDVEQNMSMTFTKTESLSRTWDYTVAFTVGASAGGKVGIPFVEEGEVKVEVSNTHSWSSSNTTTEDVAVSETVSVAAPPHTQVTATASFTKSVVNVPFTMYFKVDSNGALTSVGGVYNGASLWNVLVSYKQEAI
jgi:hypothetical protein